ncbi:MAG TPA: hypothetical protein VFX28_02360 [Methylomirabilota bacterium]|nr:hypothetical protein [Methylomirabilota bacterium]
MRLAVYLVWALLAVAVLLPFLNRHRLRVASGRPDELVKDPVCHTYVVRSRAVSRSRAGDDGPRYFCSAECARRYAGG